MSHFPVLAVHNCSASSHVMMFLHIASRYLDSRSKYCSDGKIISFSNGYKFSKILIL